MEVKDFSYYKNETFDVLPERVTGCNFEGCTFNSTTVFERCNIRKSVINQSCWFDRSNVIECTGTGLDSSTFDKSNRIDDESEREHELNSEHRTGDEFTEK